MRALIVVLVAACGTPMPSWEPDAGPCVTYVSTANLMTPTVSFKTDVVPVFEMNCISASCHGVTDSPKGNLFLGAMLAQGSDSPTVRSNLVDTTSDQLPTMKFITAGDPSHSYLMHKVDSDQCMYNSECALTDCMKSMPFSDKLLPVETRDIIRRWIAQGAADN